ncbi:ABC transporter substrate-binding protein [Frisingicoccus caecimuris]|uniref:Putative hydroxymethylpyrimidine transport system substrate-binding protein n=1 Tax=Frisingicoccus caecimuris TaxID=1796636 RepID=A0A4R2LWP8_9FIRM|nr:ABC transporter substrate-binding protein [Frisingicoccus caecimuris]MCR1919105.1 ABC transporter substrate-binding protein [Frisingicoccus caecimuris]TCO84581.1 putative hydroxymethylpyrimidine transport system substrate-binding protein [Frisingicoccus caecimuris]
MKKILVTILCGAMLLSMTACGQNGTKETKKTADGTESMETAGAAAEEGNSELKEVNVVLDWYPNAVHAFIYDAIEKGYYAEEGIKVNVQFPSNTNDAMSLTAAGKAEVGIYYLPDVIMARANQNVPIRCIGALTQSDLNIILSLKEKNINGPEDLAGKTIGYSGTELSEAMIRTMMETAGVPTDSVTLVDVGFDLMSSMTTGQVDATIGCMVNHEVPQMEKEGFEVSYFYPQEYGVPKSYELIFVTSDDMINNDADTLAAFMRASARGFEDMKADPEAALDILLANQNAENFPLDKDVEMRSMEVLMPVLTSSEGGFGAQEASVWQENIDWLKEEGLLKNDITPEELMADVLN